MDLRYPDPPQGLGPPAGFELRNTPVPHLAARQGASAPGGGYGRRQEDETRRLDEDARARRLAEARRLADAEGRILDGLNSVDMFTDIERTRIESAEGAEGTEGADFDDEDLRYRPPVPRLARAVAFVRRNKCALLISVVSLALTLAIIIHGLTQ